MQDNNEVIGMLLPALSEAEEDELLYAEALKRLGSDDGIRLTEEQVFETESESDDEYDPQFI